jgi:hypothetical protein
MLSDDGGPTLPELMLGRHEHGSSTHLSLVDRGIRGLS